MTSSASTRTLRPSHDHHRGTAAAWAPLEALCGPGDRSRSPTTAGSGLYAPMPSPVERKPLRLDTPFLCLSGTAQRPASRARSVLHNGSGASVPAVALGRRGEGGGAAPPASPGLSPRPGPGAVVFGGRRSPGCPKPARARSANPAIRCWRLLAWASSARCVTGLHAPGRAAATGVELGSPTGHLDMLDHPGLVEVSQAAALGLGGLTSALQSGQLGCEQLVVGDRFWAATAASPALSRSGRASS